MGKSIQSHPSLKEAKDSAGQQNEHDVIEDKVADGFPFHRGNIQDKKDGGKVDLASAHKLKKVDDRSGEDCSGKKVSRLAFFAYRPVYQSF